MPSCCGEHDKEDRHGLFSSQECWARASTLGGTVPWLDQWMVSPEEPVSTASLREETRGLAGYSEIEMQAGPAQLAVTSKARPIGSFYAPDSS